MQMLVTLTTYVVTVLICYGVAYLLNADVTDIIAYVALAMAVDALMRVD
jgi:hypothetical protein